MTQDTNVNVCFCSIVSDFATLQTVHCQALLSMKSSSKNTGMVKYFLLQGLCTMKYSTRSFYKIT